VQVRARRLEEFLRCKEGKLDARDAEGIRSFRAAAEDDEDEYGWSNVKGDLVKIGVVVGVAAAAAVAIAAGIQAFSKAGEDKKERR
jgi:hypothetical protein